MSKQWCDIYYGLGWQEVEAQDGAAGRVDRKTVARLLQRGVQAGALEVHAVELQPRSGSAARQYEIVTLPGGLIAETIGKVRWSLAHMTGAQPTTLAGSSSSCAVRCDRYPQS